MVDNAPTMDAQRYIVMGAGEVGFHLARVLAHEGHSVTVIERDPQRQLRVSEELDVLLVAGDGAHYPVLEQAGAGDCDLFMAVSSNDDANLVASLLAKQLGARRTVVRVSAAEGIFERRAIYEQHFAVDLLLSTQLLTTTRILNKIRGHNTMAVETYAGGRVQLRKLHLEAESLLTQRPLKDIDLPRDSLVVALFRGEELIIPSGDDQPQPGDDALILGKAGVIAQFERMVSDHREDLGKVVIAGGGQTGRAVARALEKLAVKVSIIERDRSRAEQLAALFPRFEILHGDATDLALLTAERVADARTFVALMGNDEADVLACLLAQELGVAEVIAMVQRTETTALWQRLGLKEVFSPRGLANERIHDYIRNGYNLNIVSLSRGAAQVVERRLYAASPAAGATLADISPPRGMIVGTVVRGDKAFVPRGGDRLEEGDLVILFVKEEEMHTVQLLFPDPNRA
jgi:trk system potassium uptake protein TrkA